MDATTAATRELRAALRQRYGAGRYRIAADGTVSAYGAYPQATHLRGWRLIGYVGDPRLWHDHDIASRLARLP